MVQHEIVGGAGLFGGDIFILQRLEGSDWQM
jgi:hypothetical protein